MWLHDSTDSESKKKYKFTCCKRIFSPLLTNSHPEPESQHNPRADGVQFRLPRTPPRTRSLRDPGVERPFPTAETPPAQRPCTACGATRGRPGGGRGSSCHSKCGSVLTPDYPDACWTLLPNGPRTKETEEMGLLCSPSPRPPTKMYFLESAFNSN